MRVNWTPQQNTDHKENKRIKQILQQSQADTVLETLMLDTDIGTTTLHNLWIIRTRHKWIDLVMIQAALPIGIHVVNDTLFMIWKHKHLYFSNFDLGLLLLVLQSLDLRGHTGDMRDAVENSFLHLGLSLHWPFPFPKHITWCPWRIAFHVPTGHWVISCLTPNFSWILIWKH